MKKTRFVPLLSACAALALALAACGGGGGSAGLASPGGGTPTTPGGGTTAATFSRPATWTFALPAQSDAVCYDIDSQEEVACDNSTQWDLKVLGDGSSAGFWTNGGVSGPGQGGAFGGPFDHTWADLSQWQNALTDPEGGTVPAQAFSRDASSGVFTGANDIQSAAFEYDLDGANHLFPSYRVFLITTDSSQASATSTAATPVYALQVIGYYNTTGDGASGHPTLRWIDRSTPDNVHTRTYNASKSTVHVNLATGEPVSADGNWQVALNRFNVSLNGGSSGSGTVAGFVGRTPDGLYAADGAPNNGALMAATPDSTLQYLTAADMAEPATAGDWTKDSTRSVLNPDPRGAPTGGAPTNPIEYGWYTYYPTTDTATAVGLPAAHMLKAVPEGASLIRSGTGNSYARLHVTAISYAEPNAGAQQSWTIEFGIQPAPAN
ncbi:MAG: hypothetical protein EPN72_07020 [Nevskiaceae bacterium]|nr:MAG: hypothetical protein EPN63_10720 [Nevskiaceae bacterium]TBR73248.1 MAG: hypothetical protein EPN72_07020 [Nevskiaceae bacterium]